MFVYWSLLLLSIGILYITLSYWIQASLLHGKIHRAKPHLAQWLLFRQLPSMGVSSFASGVQPSNTVIWDFHLQICWAAFTAIIECMQFSDHMLHIADKPFYFSQAWLNETAIKLANWIVKNRNFYCNIFVVPLSHSLWEWFIIYQKTTNTA